MTTYTALTIGPIYDTFTQAKLTRSIWAASYFFSLFARKVLEQAIQQNWKVLLPFSEEVKKSGHGAGLYADRLYFKDKTREELQKLVNDVITFFVVDMLGNNTKLTENEVRNFLKNFLNTHIVEISLTDEELNEIKESRDEEGTSNNSVLRILNNLLDNKELNKRYVFNFENNYLIDYFSVKWNENTALKTDAFGEFKDRHFKSIGEIATEDLSENNDYKKVLMKDFRNVETEFIKELSKITQKNDKGKDISIVQDYHKYYAVLYADGDNIGALLNKVANSDEQLKTFSKKLFEFGLRAEKSIADYGGSPIYLGGEDILAFLPIAYNDEKSLKSLAVLIRDLDKYFYKTLGEYASEQKVTIPTLSYGLMLTYHKFPMREAMQQAHDMLECCKTKKKLFPNKNGISVRFQKHSGQYMECFIDKSKVDSTKKIFELLTKGLQKKDKKDTLTGLTQRLKDDLFFSTFVYAVRNNRIDAFFENFFNEEIHKQKITFTDYFKDLSNALKADYLITDNNKEKEEGYNKRFKDILFTVLRYYQFIQPKK